MPHDLEAALAVFAAVMAANALRWASRWVTDLVRGTPNKLDDKLWAAVQKGVGAALEGKRAVDDTAKWDGVEGKTELKKRQ